jgi:hypothetical protein
MSTEIPTVTFCELVRHPQLYFDKVVRVTATHMQATEGSYLSDDACPLKHDDQIGVGSMEVGEQEAAQRSAMWERLHSIEYGGRARVTVTGILRNKSRRDFVWYRYRFDIISLEELAHIVVPYEDVLQAGITYRAPVRGDESAGLALASPVRMNEHYAVRLEWTNLTEFPALKALRAVAGEKLIVFSVISDEIKHIDVQRWNRTIRCKIIRVE